MKILYVSTISNTINAFMIPHIQMLIDQGHSVDIACSIQKDINKRMIEQGCKVFDISFSRSPLRKSNVKAYQNLKNLIVDQKYDIVHTHTPVASAIVRLVCKNIKEPRVIYTAHGFHFYTGAPIKNWLIYYPLERWLSKYTDTLITINKEDYERAKNNFKTKRVEYIPGVGLDIEKFRNAVVDKAAKRQEICVPQDSFVILSVGELNKNKNHEVIIRAIAKLNNPIIHYVICGRGPLESYLKKLALELGIHEKVHLLGYRADVNEIFKVSDIFIFPSQREGLPVSLMEAMASGLPIICSDIRGNSDLIENEVGGYLVSSDDYKKIADYINTYIENNQLKKQFIKNNYEKIARFSIGNVLLSLRKIHLEKTTRNEAK